MAVQSSLEGNLSRPVVTKRSTSAHTTEAASDTLAKEIPPAEGSSKTNPDSLKTAFADAAIFTPNSSLPQKELSATQSSGESEAFEKFVKLVEQRSDNTASMLAILLKRRDMINEKIIQIRSKQEKLIESLLSRKLEEEEAFNAAMDVKLLEREMEELLSLEDERRRTLVAPEESSDSASTLLPNSTNTSPSPSLSQFFSLEYRPQSIELKTPLSLDDARDTLNIIRTQKETVANVRMTAQALEEQARALADSSTPTLTLSELTSERIRDINVAETSATATYEHIISQQEKGLLAQANQNQLRVLQLLK